MIFLNSVIVLAAHRVAGQGGVDEGLEFVNSASGEESPGQFVSANEPTRADEKLRAARVLSAVRK